MRKKTIFVTAVSAAALLAPAVAHAAPSTASIESLSHVGRELKVAAPQGDKTQHAISIAASSIDELVVTDTAGVVPIPGGTEAACTQVDATTIRCPRKLGGILNAYIIAVVLDGGDGDDVLNASLTPDPAAPGGIDVGLGGNGGNDVLIGGGGWDGLFGGGGRDRIDGGAGNDEAEGQGGGDRIVGGAGLDELTGGTGVDRLNARDGQRDKALNCGGGDDRRERANVDRADPAAKSC